MARVVEAYDLTLRRPVAIKFLRAAAADAEGRARFLREARAAASFVHPHAITVYDVGEEARRPYLVMELVRGPSLAQVLTTRGPLEPGEAISIAAQMLEALSAAHDRGWVHRDVKPTNVLFFDADTVKLADFGLAKSVYAMTEGVTRPGQVLGTPMYLAPEQSTGRGATLSSDLYSVGVVLFQMLTGRLPFTGRSLADLAAAHRHAPVPPLGRPEVPALLEAAVKRAMAKEPARRHPSARAMQAALVAAGAGVSIDELAVGSSSAG